MQLKLGTVNWQGWTQSDSRGPVTCWRLRYVTHLIDQDTRKLLFNAIVQSRLNYADVVWDSCSEKLNNQLQKIQNSGIRFIFGLKKFDHVSEYRQILKWVDVKGKRKQHTLQLFHKIKLNRSPLTLWRPLTPNERTPPACSTSAAYSATDLVLGATSVPPRSWSIHLRLARSFHFQMV